MQKSFGFSKERLMNKRRERNNERKRKEGEGEEDKKKELNLNSCLTTPKMKVLLY